MLTKTTRDWLGRIASKAAALTRTVGEIRAGRTERVLNLQDIVSELNELVRHPPRDLE